VPQETKSFPFDPNQLEVAPGTAHQNLEGLVPKIDAPDELRAAIEMAFDYRGDVTVQLKNGRTHEGYIFDRRVSPNLADCQFRLLSKDSDQKIFIRYTDLARLSFTGRDTAAGKSFETWVKKYRQKKEAGETNIRLDPEKLD